MKKKHNISFVGGGNMGQALIESLLNYDSNFLNIHVIDLNPDLLSFLSKRFAITTSKEIDSKIIKSDVIVLVIKPQDLSKVCKSLIPFLKKQLIISLVAGINSDNLNKMLNGYKHIVRVMPNTASKIRKSISGVFCLPEVCENKKKFVDIILQAVGKTIWFTEESKIDTITAVSGSGPAYIFYFFEVIEKAAIQLGLSKKEAREVVLETFIGSTEMIKQIDKSPFELREKVTSKGGTTFAAVNFMEQELIGEKIIKAIHLAKLRCKEINEEFGK